MSSYTKYSSWIFPINKINTMRRRVISQHIIHYYPHRCIIRTTTTHKHIIHTLFHIFQRVSCSIDAFHLMRLFFSTLSVHQLITRCSTIPCHSYIARQSSNSHIRRFSTTLRSYLYIINHNSRRITLTCIIYPHKHQFICSCTLLCNSC